MAIVKKRRPAPVRVREPWEVEEFMRKRNEDNQLNIVENSDEQIQEIKIDNQEENKKETYEKSITEENKLFGFRASKSNEKDKVKRSSNGIMSIVNAKTGKRIVFARTLLNTLNNPEKVFISFSNNKLAIAERLPENNNSFTLRYNNRKATIYSTDLIMEMINIFSLDFSDKTTITFTEVEYIECEGTTVAIITINNEVGDI